MSNALIPYTDIEHMGQTIAKSGLFGVKTAEQAIALMLIAQAEGKHPATAAQEYHVIQGRASLKADQMLARFQNAGGSIKWLKRTDSEASAEFSHPQGGSLTVAWTMDRAKKADLAGKDNWKKYPAQMLSARVISEGVRAVYPAACGSFYTPEEVQDLIPLPKEPEQPAVVIEEKTEPKKAEKTVVKEKTEPKKEEKSVVKEKPTVPQNVRMQIIMDEMDRICMFDDVAKLDEYIQSVAAEIKQMDKQMRDQLSTVYFEAKKILTNKAQKGAAA